MSPLLKKFSITIAAVVVLTILIWQGATLLQNEQTVSAEEVQRKVEQQYKGEITAIERSEDRYLVSITLETGSYELVVAEDGGRILGMERVSESRPEDDPPTSEEDPASDPAEPKDADQPITRDQAVDIAKDQVEGTVDDVDYESDEEGSYFLVEIERSDELEATVQVNAITGEIMSVSWED
ncbi:PepSY domain-containing protein [Jeotgalibacillus sp. ET6]|uniref:PepSY domain-containing protein n=1 Tax=Jeotgalibacillus sp. ET6 TaxID=3037260 RepID=UPI0024182475|nr:PepSY domain-containing protein [Jeotgalibacillus sp. ET6]MDG5471228.1 PepSY domain-containing protein [Jeotgalibacillus sp. ET6]